MTGLTLLVAASFVVQAPGAQAAQSRLPDAALMKGFKLQFKVERPDYGSERLLRSADGAQILIVYTVAKSAKAAQSALSNGPPAAGQTLKVGSFTKPMIGDKSWVTTWPDGQPAGTARLVVLLGDTVFAGVLTETTRKDKQTVPVQISPDDLKMLETVVIDAAHRKSK